MNQPFCSPVKALRSVLDAAALLPSPSPETIPLEAACGRIAAADLCARMDQPPFDRSPLDGYALHSADTAGASRENPVTLPVVMKLYAGDAPAAALPAGCAARIMTGAPLPEGADCVLMQELTDSGEETVQLYAAVKPLQNVVFRGEDVAAGAVIAPAGTVLTPAHLGVLAGQGYAEVTVCRPLTVGILSTGSELLAPGAPWAPGKIYDANGIQNAARLRQLGFAVERQQCSDDPEVITGKMQELLTRCDAVITSGGVSVGQKDYLPLVLEKLGAQLLVEGVAQKPGSPMLAAALGGKLVLCLSGNPFAAAAGAVRHPRAAARRRTPGGELHPHPHRLHPDQWLFQTQQGQPLPAGDCLRRQGDPARRGQHRGTLLRCAVRHDGLQLSGGDPRRQRAGRTRYRSGGALLCTVNKNRHWPRHRRSSARRCWRSAGCTTAVRPLCWKSCCPCCAAAG